MRRLNVALTVLAAAAGLTAGLATGGAAAKPQLRVDSLRPLEVAGSGFRADETVRVSVRAGTGTGSRSDAVSAAGRIEVRFPRLKLGRCPEYVIAARGDRGSRAGLRSVPRPCGIDP